MTGRAGMARQLVAGLATLATVLLVVQLNAPRIEPAHLLRYRLGETDRKIVATLARGHCDPRKDTRVEEGVDSVRLTILVERTRGTCTADIVFDDVAVTLAEPLAGRALTD